jgi:hypothetical protein
MKTCSVQEACDCIREVLGLTYHLQLQGTGTMIFDAAVRRLCGNTSSSSHFAAALREWPGFVDIFSGLTLSFPAEARTQHFAQLIPQKSLLIEGNAKLLLVDSARLIVASLLSSDKQQEWRLLFNSDLHGKSFATFTGRVVDKGPTVVVVCSFAIPQANTAASIACTVATPYSLVLASRARQMRNVEDEECTQLVAVICGRCRSDLE